MKKTFKILRVLIFISSVSLLVSCKFFSSSDSKSIQKTVDTAEVIKLHLAAAESLSEICTSPSMNEKMDGFFESRREAYMPPSSDGSVKTGVFYQSHISSNPGDVQGWMKNKAPEEVARELYYQDMRASLRNRLRSELILRSQEVEFHMLPFNLSGDGLRAKTPTCDIVKKTDRDGLATTILSNDRELGQVSRHLSTVNEYTWEFTAAVIAERSFEALFIEDFIIGGGWKRLGDRMGVVSFDKDIFFPFYPDSSSPMGLKNPAQVLDQIYAELPLLTWEMKEDGKIFGKETLARQIMGISAGGTRSNFGPWFTDFVIKSGKLALRIQQARQNDQIKATLEVLNIVSLTEDQMRVIGGIMQYLKTDFPQEKNAFMASLNFASREAVKKLSSSYYKHWVSAIEQARIAACSSQDDFLEEHTMLLAGYFEAALSDLKLEESADERNIWGHVDFFCRGKKLDDAGKTYAVWSKEFRNTFGNTMREQAENSIFMASAGMWMIGVGFSALSPVLIPSTVAGLVYTGIRLHRKSYYLSVHRSLYTLERKALKQMESEKNFDAVLGAVLIGGLAPMAGKYMSANGGFRMLQWIKLKPPAGVSDSIYTAALILAGINFTVNMALDWKANVDQGFNPLQEPRFYINGVIEWVTAALTIKALAVPGGAVGEAASIWRSHLTSMRNIAKGTVYLSASSVALTYYIQKANFALSGTEVDARLDRFRFLYESIYDNTADSFINISSFFMVLGLEANLRRIGISGNSAGYSAGLMASIYAFALGAINSKLMSEAIIEYTVGGMGFGEALESGARKLELFGIGEHHGNAISSLTQFTDELRSTVKERIDYIGAGVIPSSDRGGNLEPMTKEGQLLELRQHLAESFLAKDSPNKHNFEITPEVMGSLHEITSKFVGGHEELHTLVGLNVHLFKMSEEFDPKAPNVKFGN